MGERRFTSSLDLSLVGMRQYVGLDQANMYKYVIPSGNSRVCSRTSLFFIGKSSSFSMGHFPSNK